MSEHMVKVSVTVERNGQILQQDWIEVSGVEYDMFERRLWGWGSANFIGHLVDRMITGMGMNGLKPQRYADKAKCRIFNP